MTTNPFDNGKPLAKGIPDAAFDATPQLHALSLHEEAPAAVYAAAASHAAANIRSGVLTPIGTEPNLHVVLRGPSGCGKGSVWRNAQGRVPHTLTRLFGYSSSWGAALEAVKDGGAMFELERDSLYQQLLGQGESGREKYLTLYDGGTIERKRNGVEGGTYRCIVHAEVQPYVDGWLFTPYAVERGITTRFLFAHPQRYDDEPRGFDWHRSAAEMLSTAPAITLPDWSVVPDGPLPCPKAAKADMKRYLAIDTLEFERQLIRLRFTVATAHAALHGRTVITDEDWGWTQYPMELSRSICCHEYEVAQREWTWTNGSKPPVRHTITRA